MISASLYFITALALTALLSAETDAATLVDLSQDWQKGPLYNKNAGYCNMQKEGFTQDGRIHGYAVVKDGILVAEGYSNESIPTELIPAYSTTKSWSTMLIGHLLEARALDINWTLGDIFNETTDWENVTDVTEKQSVGLLEVMSMSGGLYDGVPLDTMDFKVQENLMQVLQNMDYVQELRGKFEYMGANQIVSQIIYRSSGMSPKELATTSGIFPALGLQDGIDYVWDAYGGIEGSAYGMNTNPRSMAKLGQLYLQKGVSSEGGEQLIRESWIEMSTKNQLQDGDTTEMDNLWHGYGYQWWVGVEGTGDAADIPSMKGMYAAFGAYGQFILVAPEVNMVVTTTTADVFEDLGGQDARDLLLMAFRDVDDFDVEVQDAASCMETAGTADGTSAAAERKNGVIGLFWLIFTVITIVVRE